MALHCWPTKTHSITAASFDGQPLSIIQHIIMVVFIANEPKNALLLPPLLINNYPSSWLPPLLASKNTQHHCSLPCWPATCCLHCWPVSINSFAVTIAGQQPPPTMAVSIPGQQPLVHCCLHCWPATTDHHGCIHAWPITIHHNYFCSLRNPRVVPRRSFPYECDMAAGAFSDELSLIHI